MSEVQQGVIPAHFYDICNTQNQVLPGYGSILEFWDCNSNSWEFVACGKDMSPPKVERGEIEVTPSCGDASSQQGGLIFPEYIPSNRVEVETFEIH